MTGNPPIMANEFRGMAPKIVRHNWGALGAGAAS